MKPSPQYFPNILEVARYFENPSRCRKYLEALRWSNGIQCPHCESERKIYRMRHNFKCADCLQQFSHTKGSIFENSKIPLKKWFMAMYLLSAHKKGVSSYQLARDLEVTQKTAWFMAQRIREAFPSDYDPQIIGTVEVDETYIGGKFNPRRKSGKANGKGSQGRGGEHKIPVFGIFNRETGEVRAQVVNSTGSRELVPIIEQHVKPDSTVISDEWNAYNSLSENYYHYRVNHSAKQYAKGRIHTNNIENFWGVMKRGIRGIYHHLSRKHLDRYISEFSFRYNNRAVIDSDRFNELLTRVNRRLSYRDLVGDPNGVQEVEFINEDLNV